MAQIWITKLRSPKIKKSRRNYKVAQSNYKFAHKLKSCAEQMDMLVSRAKRRNLMVSVSRILNLWKRFWMSLIHEFTGKKERPSIDSLFEFCSSQTSYSERDSIVWILKEGYMCWRVKFWENVMAIKIARNFKYS